MKKYVSLLLIGLVMLMHASCRTTHAHKTPPPGQVKKVTGTQSARPYAPGQVKKATGSKSAAPYAPGQHKAKQKKKKNH